MSGIAAHAGDADVRPVDAFVNAVRRAINRVLPYYDPHEAEERQAEKERISQETERVRKQSVFARLRAEGFGEAQARDIAERYRRQDGVLRR